ncbi:MAG: RNA polymerase sigma factor [Planctomycetales bacterium]
MPPSSTGSNASPPAPATATGKNKTPQTNLWNISPLKNTPATTDGQGPQREAAELLELLMQRLPPEDRLVITLLHLEEYVAEIARQTGWSESNVKVRAHRARGKLAVWLEERGHV